MKFAYYPGCSSVASSSEYHQSILDVSTELGIYLEEIPDWNCCGASSGHMVNTELSMLLAARNIALAEKMSLDLVTSCPNCFLRHKVAEHELRNNPDAKLRVEQKTNANLNLSIKTKHMLQILHDELGLNHIRERVKYSLKGLKAVTYYGCYLVRPPAITSFDDPENPVVIDKIMEVLDVEVIDWDQKVDCCGGGLLIASPEVATSLANNIIVSAFEAEASAIVTACPMCQSNLEISQLKNKNDPRRVPVIFFSELMALAFGSTRAKEYLARHVVSTSGLFKNLAAPIVG